MIHWLLRHGEAAPGVDDAARPLTERGRREVERTVRHLARAGAPVAQVRHSGLLRARQTAEIAAALLRPEGGVAEDPALGPDVPPGELAAALEASDRPLLLVGHLPLLGRLVGVLTAGSDRADPVRITPATLVALSRDAGRWQLVGVLPPALLPGD
jgi:phosphohistidine phosphatase